MLKAIKGFEMFFTRLFFTDQLEATIWDVEDESFNP